MEVFEFFSKSSRELLVHVRLSVPIVISISPVDFEKKIKNGNQDLKNAFFDDKQKEKVEWMFFSSDIDKAR